MYDLLDRPICELPAVERGILDATRRWVHAATLAGDAFVQDRRDAFGKVMRALHDGSMESLLIQRPCYDTVEETEAVILSIWRMVRAGRMASASSAAELLVDRVHGRAMIAAMACANA